MYIHIYCIYLWYDCTRHMHRCMCFYGDITLTCVYMLVHRSVCNVQTSLTAHATLRLCSELTSLLVASYLPLLDF